MLQNFLDNNSTTLPVTLCTFAYIGYLIFSKEEPKGADCLEQFQAMQECMKEYPELYDKESERGEASMADINVDDEQHVKDATPGTSETRTASKTEVSTHTGSSETNDNLNDQPTVQSRNFKYSASEKATVETSNPSSQTSTQTDREQTRSAQKESEISDSPSISTYSATSLNSTNTDSQAVTTQGS